MSKGLLNSKKAQGLSLNTIIIAIIVLIVLVVLVMIFTGYFGKIFTPSVKSCATQGGACVAKCNEGSYGSLIGGASDCPEKTVCCSKVSEEGFGFKKPVDAESCELSKGGTCVSLGTKKEDTSCVDKEATSGTAAVVCKMVPETCKDKGTYSGQISATGCAATQVCCK